MCWKDSSHALIPRAVRLLVELAFDLRVLGDYLVYRCGLAGSFANSPFPRAFHAVMVVSGTIGLLLALPGIAVFASWLLIHWNLPVVPAVVLGVAAMVGTFYALRRFRRAWMCVNCHQVGSAGRLTGRCIVFYLFFGDNWRVMDQHHAGKALRAACDWLESEGERHSVAVDLVTWPETWCELGCRSLPTRSSVNMFGWHTRQMLSYQCHDAVSHIEELRSELQTEISARLAERGETPASICLVINLPYRDMGLALPVANDLGEDRHLEICLCGWPPSPVVYAHELLHLFGAPDLYLSSHWILTEEGDGDVNVRLREWRELEAGRSEVRAHFGHSVMGSRHAHLETACVDPITARSIGWRDADSTYIEAVVTAERVAERVLAGVANEPDEPDDVSVPTPRTSEKRPRRRRPPPPVQGGEDVADD